MLVIYQVLKYISFCGFDEGSLEGGSLKNVREAREFDGNRVVLPAEEVSSTNRTPRLYHLDSGMYRGNVENKRRLDDHAVEEERGSICRASDDDEEKGSSRKKLKLSKQQSAVLEESFEEHSTLNPVRNINIIPFLARVWGMLMCKLWCFIEFTHVCSQARVVYYLYVSNSLVLDEAETETCPCGTTQSEASSS